MRWESALHRQNQSKVKYNGMTIFCIEKQARFTHMWARHG
jgi:hypothetical protein